MNEFLIQKRLYILQKGWIHINIQFIITDAFQDISLKNLQSTPGVDSNLALHYRTRLHVYKTKILRDDLTPAFP